MKFSRGLVDVQNQKMNFSGRFENIVNSLNQTICELDLEGRIIYLNNSGKRLFGIKNLTRKKTINLFTYFATEDQARLKFTMQKILEGQIDKGLEYNIRLKDNISISVILFLNIIVKRRTIIGFSALIMDNRGSNKVEGNLNYAQENYDLFLNNNLTGKLAVKPNGEIVACNDTFLKIFHFESVEEAKKINFYNLYPNTKDKDKILKTITEKKSLYNITTKMQTFDGRSIYLLENVIGKFNETGKLVGLNYYIIDNTKRETAIQLLRENEEIFNSFLENSPTYIVIRDSNLNVIKLSKNFEKLLGKPLDRLIGTPIYESFPPEFANKMRESDKNVMNKGIPVMIEQRLND